MGWLSGKRSTIYQVERPWHQSPEVWKTMAKIFLFGVGAGIALAIWAGCSDVAKDAQSNVPCKPGPSATSSNNNHPGSG